MSGRKVRNRRDDALSRISWQDFERLLATYYRGQGYQVEHVGTAATSARYDGGIDLKLRRNDEYVLVQCKHWNAWQVAHNDVHQLLGIMVNQSATGAILITSGEFTRAAREAAQKQGHVQLVDGDALRQMVGPLAQPECDALPPPNGNDDHQERSRARREPAAPLRRVDTPRALGHHVASRLLSAAEDRIRHGKDGGRRHDRSGNAGLIKLIGGLMALGLLLVFVQTVASTLIGSLTSSLQPPTPTPTAAPVDLPAPAAGPGQVTPMPTVYGREAAPTAAAAPRFDQGMSADELRRWKRRNAESMKALEATTPEM